jgi:hypothetical protein
MSLTEEETKAIKEDIQRGLSSREIISKYHIPVFQYTEIKNSMQSHDYISESRPAVVRTRRHRGSVSFPGLIFLVLFAITLFYLIYRKVSGPVLGMGYFVLLIFGIGTVLFFIIDNS